MPRKQRIASVACCLLYLTTVGGTGLCAAEPWWNKDWKCRRKITAVAQTKAAGSDVCHAEFFTGGLAKDNASDLRVVEGGKPVPHRVLFAGPGDFVKLAIKMGMRSKTQRVFYAYYGNPSARPLSHKFDIKRGLLLEVRHYKGGGAGSWSQMQRTLEKSEGFVMDAGFVKTIHHGHNPFGPSENCVTIYRGWINCRQAGTYVFAITSDDASFMFIDGKLMVQWPGVHRAVPYAHKSRQKAMRLSAGLHKVEYYHLQLGDRYAAVAAWAPPWAKPWKKGKKQFEVIPEQVFGKITRGSVGPYERADKAPCPDFTAAKRGEAFLDGRPLVKVGFLDRTKPKPITTKPTRWDWGDGNQSEGKMAEHIYVSPGLYKVTMTVEQRRKPYTVTQVVDAFQDWGKQVERKTDPLASYYPVVSKYAFTKMPPSSLLAAARYFERLEKWNDLVRVASVIVKRGSEFGETDLYKWATTLTENMSRHLRKHSEAIMILGKVEEQVKAVPYKARLALAAGDLAVRQWRNPDQAARHYQRVISKYGKAGSDSKRRAVVGLGDMYRQQGEYEDALKKYEEAELIPVSGQPYKKAAVRVGTLARAIEFYTNQKYSKHPRHVQQGIADHATAAQMLDTWEWEYPTQKLLGHSTVLRARLAHKLKQYDVAVPELEEFVAVNPKSNYVGEALIVLAESYFAKGEPKKARNVLETLIADYRDSDQVEKAKSMLEMADKYPGSVKALEDKKASKAKKRKRK